MPKFGTGYETIVVGIANTVLITSLLYEEPITYWFLQTIEPCMETFD